MKYPKAYKRNTQTKLLWLYKIGLITRNNYEYAKYKLMDR